MITKTDLDAAIKGVTDDQNDVINKRTVYVVSRTYEYFKKVTEGYKKRYEGFIKTDQKKLLSDVEKKVKDEIRGNTDAAISKLRTELMSHNYLNNPADIRKYIGSQIENKVDPVISDLDARVKRICVGEDMELRCAAFFPFTATVGSNKEFYVINGDGYYIEISINCKIIFVKGDHDVKIRWKIVGGAYHDIPLLGLLNDVVSKGTPIHINLLPDVDVVSGILVLEYTPWNVSKQIFFLMIGVI